MLFLLQYALLLPLTVRNKIFFLCQSYVRVNKRRKLDVMGLILDALYSKPTNRPINSTVIGLSSITFDCCSHNQYNTLQTTKPLNRANKQLLQKDLC